MARKSGFVRRSNVMRRDTIWIGGTWATATLASTSSAAILTQFSAGALALRPFTVIRTRGIATIKSD